MSALFQLEIVSVDLVPTVQKSVGLIPTKKKFVGLIPKNVQKACPRKIKLFGLRIPPKISVGLIPKSAVKYTFGLSTTSLFGLITTYPYRSPSLYREREGGAIPPICSCLPQPLIALIPKISNL